MKVTPYERRMIRQDRVYIALLRDLAEAGILTSEIVETMIYHGPLAAKKLVEREDTSEGDL